MKCLKKYQAPLLSPGKTYENVLIPFSSRNGWIIKPSCCESEMTVWPSILKAIINVSVSRERWLKGE